MVIPGPCQQLTSLAGLHTLDCTFFPPFQIWRRTSSMGHLCIGRLSNTSRKLEINELVVCEGYVLI